MGAVVACLRAETVSGHQAFKNVAVVAGRFAMSQRKDVGKASRPDGTDPGAGQLGGLTLLPGVYKSASGAFLITGLDLTLDAHDHGIQFEHLDPQHRRLALKAFGPRAEAILAAAARRLDTITN